MPSGCSIRALWILNNQDTVVFSRRFPVAEKRWRTACEKENRSTGGGADDDAVKQSAVSYLPTDSEFAAAFFDRKKRESSLRGYGIRTAQSVQGSDSWVDDPITRHVISLYINKEDEGNSYLLWPLVLHIKGPCCILVLPLVEPHHLKTYARMLKQPDCGTAVGMDDNLSSILLDSPSITG